MIMAKGPKKLLQDTFFSTHLSFLRLMVRHELALTLMTISKKLARKGLTTLVRGTGLDRRPCLPTEWPLVGPGYIYPLRVPRALTCQVKGKSSWPGGHITH